MKALQYNAEFKEIKLCIVIPPLFLSSRGAPYFTRKLTTEGWLFSAAAINAVSPVK